MICSNTNIKEYIPNETLEKCLGHFDPIESKSHRFYKNIPMGLFIHFSSQELHNGLLVSSTKCSPDTKWSPLNYIQYTPMTQRHCCWELLHLETSLKNRGLMYYSFNSFLHITWKRDPYQSSTFQQSKKFLWFQKLFGILLKIIINTPSFINGESIRQHNQKESIHKRKGINLVLIQAQPIWLHSIVFAGDLKVWRSLLLVSF